MVEKVWRSLLEVTELNSPSSEPVLFERLAKAVAELNLPSAFLERIQAAVAVAIRRAWQHDPEGMGHVTLAVLLQQVEAKHLAQSWGFFLIEKRLEHTRDRRVEVFLYPDGR